MKSLRIEKSFRLLAHARRLLHFKNKFFPLLLCFFFCLNVILLDFSPIVSTVITRNLECWNYDWQPQTHTHTRMHLPWINSVGCFHERWRAKNEKKITYETRKQMNEPMDLLLFSYFDISIRKDTVDLL